MQLLAEWSDNLVALPTFAEVSRQLGIGLDVGFGPWLQLFDLPLWSLAALFSFRISAAFRGGTLGRAASWVAWALVVVAVGKATRGAVLFLYGPGAFTSELAQIAWGLVPGLAWVLAGLGIYEFYRAGRSI